MNRCSRALVIGGSIAGLLAARVLRRHFGEVVIVERDRLPEVPIARRGAPQAYHNHVLLLRGRQIMEGLFPGFQDAVVRDGGLLMDMANDLAWLTPWGWGIRFESPLRMLAASRSLIEWRLRRMSAAVPGVSFLDDVQVVGVRLAGERVTGVETSAGLLDADLVVDASGRGSRTPQWLERLGYERPRETVVNAFLGYASRFYRPSPDAARWWKGMYIQSAPPASPRVGLILPIEHGAWHVTLGGGDRQYPPADEAGFLAFAGSLRHHALADALAGAEPLSPVHATRSTENRLRRYDRIRLPDGLVVIGDAACAFNPVYGQGMTTAALGAEALHACLSETDRRTGAPHGTGLPRRFQRALGRVNAAPWMMAVSEDLRYRGTEGARADFRTRIMHEYIDIVGRSTTRDPAVRLSLLRAFHMVAPPRSLFAPGVVGRLMRCRRNGSRDPAPAGSGNKDQLVRLLSR